MRVVRLVILGVAIVVCAWYVVGIRQAHELAVARAVISNPTAHTPAALRHAGSLLNSAATLNPDAEVDILRGRLALAEHRFGPAQRILEDVARREPHNLEAWIWVAGAALISPHEEKIALDHVHQLDPRSAAP